MPHRSHFSALGLCAVTGKSLPHSKLTPLSALRPHVSEVILVEHPNLDMDALVSEEVINAARVKYVHDMLENQLGDLTHLDEEVVASLHHHELLSERPASEHEELQQLTFGERLSDRIASFGGSWRFILSFGGFLVIWILINALVLAGKPFDPYPFILLNLILSCIAALQAPVIMMSQNRLEVRDRQRAESDYKINLKAELEIRHLHEKMDYLLHRHATQLMEIQNIQLELLREMASNRQGEP